MAKELLWVAARSIPSLEPVTASLANEALFKFWLRNVDDINTLQPGEDVGALYNARRAMAAYSDITDPVRSRYPARRYRLRHEDPRFRTRRDRLDPKSIPT